MLKAVIFDFDGVITDSEILHLRAFNQSLAPYGVEIPTKDYYKTYLGFCDVDCYKMLISQGLLKIDESQISDIVKEKTRIFEHVAKTEGRTFEGVHDFLKMLEQNKIPMSICSGALLAEIELLLEEAGLRQYFTEIVSAEQVKKGKPNPEGFLLSLKGLNKKYQSSITANECIVIEDSLWGLQAGKTAGMHTVAVTNSYDAEQLNMAEKIVSRLNELTIDDLNQLCE
jgi:beta-phosphoglucomutase